ncbi:MAG: ral secretion pathway protein [Acidobacteriota bacterium]|jgi:general secretion pathway protein G|nr:ral secretion pathway protein [Acidobacteriota bacterium]
MFRRHPIIAFLLISVALGAVACREFSSEFDKTELSAREKVLRDTLFQFRKAIDTYAVDKGALPQSLGDLVGAGYIREVPDDPITGKKDWKILFGDDPNSSSGGRGIVSIHSASVAYRDW